MPLTKIKIGAAPNDGTGDTLRDAFEKINVNLDTLAAAISAKLLNQWAFAPLHHEHAGTVARYVSNVAPTEAPPTLGAMWIDLETNTIYLAAGTASASDWREVVLGTPVHGTAGKL